MLFSGGTHHKDLLTLHSFARVFRILQLSDRSKAVFGTYQPHIAFWLLIRPLFDSFGLAQHGFRMLGHSRRCLCDCGTAGARKKADGTSCASPYSTFEKTAPDDPEFVRGVFLYGLGTHLLLGAMTPALSPGSDTDTRTRVELLGSSYLAGWNHDPRMPSYADAPYSAGSQDKLNHNIFMEARNMQLERIQTKDGSIMWRNLLENGLFAGQALGGCVRTAFLQSMAGEVAPTPLTLGKPIAPGSLCDDGLPQRTGGPCECGSWAR
jgi:hypothetical protein